MSDVDSNIFLMFLAGQAPGRVCQPLKTMCWVELSKSRQRIEDRRYNLQATYSVDRCREMRNEDICRALNELYKYEMAGMQTEQDAWSMLRLLRRLYHSGQTIDVLPACSGF